MDEAIVPTDWEVYRAELGDPKLARQAAERVFAKVMQYAKKHPHEHVEIALRVAP